MHPGKHMKLAIQNDLTISGEKQLMQLPSSDRLDTEQHALI
jgi:hypothetical protein